MHRHSIRITLPLAMALVTLPVLLVFLYAMDRVLLVRTEVAQRVAGGVAQATASGILHELDDVRAALARVASSAGLSQAQPGHCDAGLRALTLLLPHVVLAAVTGPGDEVLCVAPATTGPHPLAVRDHRLPASAPRDGGPAVGEVESHPVTGRKVLVIAHPRVDESGGPLGSVTIALDLRRLQDVLVRVPQVAGRAVFVADARGRALVASIEPERWIGADLSGLALVRAFDDAGGTLAQAAGPDGRERFWARQSVGGGPWQVYVGIDREAALAAVLSARNHALGLFAAGALWAALLGIWLSRRIAEPIVALAETARAVAQGSRERRAVVQGPAEVVDVAMQFNAALDTLQRTHDAEQAAAAQIQALIDHSPEVINICDPDGRIVFANRRWHELHSGSVGEVRGRLLVDLRPPEFRDRIREQIAEVVRTGKAIVHDWDAMRPDGLHRVLVTRFPILAADGRVEYVGSIVIDVTPMHRLTGALRESEQRFATLADLAPIAIFLDDAEGRTVYVNRRWTEHTGLTARESMGTGWSRAVPPDERERVLDAIASRQARRERVAVEHRLSNVVTGAERHVRCEAVPHFSSEGAFRGYIGVVVDLTDSRRAEQVSREQVARLQSMSRRLLEVQETERRAVARELHDEVGQALAAVTAALQRLRAGAEPAAAARIEDARALVDRVIGGIRDTSLNLRPIMLDDLGLVPALRWLAERASANSGLDVQLTIESLPEEPPGPIATALFRAAQEALTNVQRHASARTVRINLALQDDALCLRVQDDGIGFDPASLAVRSASGSVFGLSGLTERVGLLGGTLELASAPGHGTLVAVRVPVPVEKKEPLSIDPSPWVERAG